MSKLNAMKARLWLIAQRWLGAPESEGQTRKLPFADSEMYHKLIVGEKEKGSGAAFVVSPFLQYFLKTWGLEPWEDYTELRRMYLEVPYIHAAINVNVNLTLCQGFDLVGGDKRARELILDKMEELNLNQALRPMVLDMNVLGNAYWEKCYENPAPESEYAEKVKGLFAPEKLATGQSNPLFIGAEEAKEAVEWNSFDESKLGDIVQLKPLDPVYMRLRVDAYGNVLGAIQFGIIFPPVVFRTWQIVHFRQGIRSDFGKSIYGLSPLNSLIGIQDKIDKFEKDFSLIVHAYGKPVLIVKAGTPERPATKDEWKDLKDAFSERQPGADIIIQGRHDVKPIQALTPASGQLSWYIDYLLMQRDAVLGVPKIFLGQSEGANRATADVVLLEYVSRLSAVQENISQQLEDNLFKPIVKANLGEDVELPEIVWRPIISPSLNERINKTVQLYRAGIITLEEARSEMGYESTPDVLEELKSLARKTTMEKVKEYKDMDELLKERGVKEQPEESKIKEKMKARKARRR